MGCRWGAEKLAPGRRAWCVRSRAAACYRECGHLVCCEVCAAKMERCPLCRRKSAWMKVYRAKGGPRGGRGEARSRDERGRGAAAEVEKSIRLENNSDEGHTRRSRRHPASLRSSHPRARCPRRRAACAARRASRLVARAPRGLDVDAIGVRVLGRGDPETLCSDMVGYARRAWRGETATRRWASSNTARISSRAPPRARTTARARFRLALARTRLSWAAMQSVRRASRRRCSSPSRRLVPGSRRDARRPSLTHPGRRQLSHAHDTLAAAAADARAANERAPEPADVVATNVAGAVNAARVYRTGTHTVDGVESTRRRRRTHGRPPRRRGRRRRRRRVETPEASAYASPRSARAG